MANRIFGDSPNDISYMRHKHSKQDTDGHYDGVEDNHVLPAAWEIRQTQGGEHILS